MPRPIIGDVVHYRLTHEDAEAINRRRQDARDNPDCQRRPGKAGLGFQVHVGNPVAGGEIVALVVTAVWGDDCVNGTALLDGNDALWITSATRDASLAPGAWRDRGQAGAVAPMTHVEPAPVDEKPEPAADVAQGPAETAETGEAPVDENEGPEPDPAAS